MHIQHFIAFNGDIKINPILTANYEVIEYLRECVRDTKTIHLSHTFIRMYSKVNTRIYAN